MNFLSKARFLVLCIPLVTCAAGPPSCEGVLDASYAQQCLELAPAKISCAAAAYCTSDCKPKDCSFFTCHGGKDSCELYGCTWNENPSDSWEASSSDSDEDPCSKWDSGSDDSKEEKDDWARPSDGNKEENKGDRKKHTSTVLISFSSFAILVVIATVLFRRRKDRVAVAVAVAEQEMSPVRKAFHLESP